MRAKIQSIDPGSPAEKAGVRIGETLIQINNQIIVDVLDYKFFGYDTQITLLLLAEDGSRRELSFSKTEGEDIGLNFETYLMDNTRTCANECIFCFVHQLPEGMRDTLYVQDDDARLSFLMGNYITLTNLSDREVQRIIDLRVTPINVSVHATDPDLRGLLLGFPNGGRGLDIMQRFAAGGIEMNCQIVSCPDINDGPALQKTMEDLAALHPHVNSISIVPVGLTKFREGLYPLEPYTVSGASAVIDMVEVYGKHCLETYGSTMFWCSDEFYIQAERPLPQDGYYEAYTQLENGVGMLRLLETEFHSAIKMVEQEGPVRSFSVATGTAAAPWIIDMIGTINEKWNSKGIVYPILNDFFGHTINVTGLITGQDLIAQLRGKELGERLLIPVNMLRHGEDVFLDDLTLDDVRRELNVEVVTVNQDGFDVCDVIFEQNQGGV